MVHLCARTGQRGARFSDRGVRISGRGVRAEPGAARMLRIAAPMRRAVARLLITSVHVAGSHQPAVLRYAHQGRALAHAELQLVQVVDLDKDVERKRA